MNTRTQELKNNPDNSDKERQTGARQVGGWYMSLTKFNHAFVVRI